MTEPLCQTRVGGQPSRPSVVRVDDARHWIFGSRHVFGQPGQTRGSLSPHVRHRGPVSIEVVSLAIDSGHVDLGRQLLLDPPKYREFQTGFGEQLVDLANRHHVSQSSVLLGQIGFKEDVVFGQDHVGCLARQNARHCRVLNHCFDACHYVLVLETRGEVSGQCHNVGGGLRR